MWIPWRSLAPLVALAVVGSDAVADDVVVARAVPAADADLAVNHAEHHHHDPSHATVAREAEHAAHGHPPGHALLGGLHDHGGHGGTSVAASIGALVGTYDARLFTGDYQGLIVGARASRGRFGAAASLPAYRLTKNGKTVGGIGDVLLHGHATLVADRTRAAGVMLMVSAPTGNDTQGLGMGHVMVMPEAWVTWVPGRFALAASLGYGRSLGGANAHAEHGGGMWPLVDPMNGSELTAGGTAMVALTRELGVGLCASGAVPLDDGDVRAAGGFRVAWIAGQVVTSAEVLGGLVGDPFGIRGVVETSIRFD